MTDPLSKIAFVDVETTGTSAASDRIMDIGIVRTENGKIVEEFQSLVNPQTHVSPYISQMTAITPEMLFVSPMFEEIKSKVYDLLDGALFVAHNAQFDYAFVKNEFARLDTKFSKKMMCTVRLSRLLFPRERHHNLGAIIERFKIQVEARHRAFPDAKALYYFLESAKRIVPEDKFLLAVREITRHPRLPSAIKSEVVRKIPNLPGIYIFYDKEGVVLYVGKSTHLKDRVMSHFSSFHSNQTDLKLASSIADIEVVRCGGDLSASLLEIETIKKLQPVFNKQLREMREAIAVIKKTDSKYHKIVLERIKLPIATDYEKILTLFPSVKRAKEALYTICKERHICPLVLGLEKGKGPCFNNQIGKCDGACVGAESDLKHNVKVIEAFGSYLVPRWPFEGTIGIEEESDDVREVTYINNWMYVGSLKSQKGEEGVYTGKETGIYSDTVKILKKFLKKRYYQKKIVKNSLPGWQLQN